MFRILGETEGTWDTYKKHIDRYDMYLRDIRAFNGTIRNFIKFAISKLKTNGPESYAEALYGFYNDDRIAEKLIINPITSLGDCYTRHDQYMLSYMPRELPDGTAAICQEHVTDSLQTLMKADYMLAPNSGHNIRRCIICGKYFMLKSGVHALYCEGTCPHAPGYTCRQFGGSVYRFVQWLSSLQNPQPKHWGYAGHRRADHAHSPWLVWHPPGRWSLSAYPS